MDEYLATYQGKCRDFACDPVPRFIELLASGEPLRSLQLKGSSKDLFNERVTMMQVYSICETLYEHPTLEVVDLSYNHLEDRSATAIARLVQVTPAIKLLDLTGNDIGPAGAAALAAALTRPSSGLAEGALLLRGNPIGDKGVEALMQHGVMPPHGRLAALDMGECHMGLRGLIAVVEALMGGSQGQGQQGTGDGRSSQANTSLLSIDLESMQPKGPEELDMCVRHLLRLIPAHCGLKELSLAKAGLTDHLLGMLTTYGFVKYRNGLNLVRLNLRANKLSPFSGPILEELLSGGPRLRALDLAHNQLGNDGAVALSRVLPTCPMLAELDLRSNNIGDIGLSALAEAMPLSSIKRILLWGNAFGPGACRAWRDVLAAQSSLQTDLQPYTVDGEACVALKSV